MTESGWISFHELRISRRSHTLAFDSRIQFPAAHNIDDSCSLIPPDSQADNFTIFKLHRLKDNVPFQVEVQLYCAALQ